MARPDAGSRRSLYLAYFSLAAVQAVFAAARLLAVPSDPKNAFLLGLSAQRWALLLVPLALLAISAPGAFTAWKRTRVFERWERWLSDRLERGSWGAVTVLSLAAALFSALFMLVAAKETLFVLAPRGALPGMDIDSYFVDLVYFNLELYIPRLAPIAGLVLGLSLQNLVLVPMIVYGAGGYLARLRAWGLPASVVVFGLGAAAFGWVQGTLENLGPDVIGWNTIGVPLLDVQVLAVGMALFLAWVLAVLVRRRNREAGGAFSVPGRLDTILFIVIWLAAALHWSSLPLQPSWYLAEPRAPNFEFYPTSDSLVYDTTAQSMLVGEGLSTRPFSHILIRRPLLSFFVGLLQTIAGGSYTTAALIQGILLAAFPAVVYLVGRDLHSRFAGLAAAGLIILREGNSIALANEITVSHAKLFMSDLPAALGIALLVWLALPWILSPGELRRRALVSGGVLGALILIRPEAAVLMPVIVAAAFIKDRRMRSWLPGLGWMTLGLFLALAPWLARNYLRTGEIYIEVPGNRMDFLIQRFRGEETGLGEPPEKVQMRASVQEEGEGVVARIGRHYLHSNLQSVLIFPASFRPLDAYAGLAEQGKPDRFWASCCGRENYVQRLAFWQWQKWELDLPPETLPAIGATLFLLSVGLVGVYRRAGMVGLMPAAAGQVYFLVQAVARTSGGRYLLPVDWIWVLYYAAGLVGVIVWLTRLCTAGRGPAWLLPVEGSRFDEGGDVAAAENGETPGGEYRRRALAWMAAAILLAGAALPLGEALYPAQYPEEAPPAWLESALGESGHEEELLALLGDPDGFVLHGRALYTRYYEAGVGEPSGAFPSLYPQPWPQLAFFVAGPTSSGVTLQVEAFPEAAHPHGEDVLVIGCRVRTPKVPYLEGVVAYFPASGEVVVRDSWDGGGCR